MFDNSWDALLRPWKADRYFAAEPQPTFDPVTRDYSAANAWWLAELSRVVYRDDGRSDVLDRAGLREVAFFESGSTQCAVVARDEEPHAFVAVVFRGTSQLRDWVTNLRAVPADWPAGGRVHRGFRRALRKVWDDVRRTVEQVELPLFYTGHSLGGALATLATSAHPPIAAYTFGAPRVGDRAFCASLASAALFRVVNQDDVVTTVPKIGFAHAGQLRHITSDDNVDDRGPGVRQPAGNELAEAWDERRWFDPVAFLSDHAPVNYVAHLTRILGREPG